MINKLLKIILVTLLFSIIFHNMCFAQTTSENYFKYHNKLLSEMKHMVNNMESDLDSIENIIDTTFDKIDKSLDMEIKQLNEFFIIQMKNTDKYLIVMEHEMQNNLKELDQVIKDMELVFVSNDL